MKCDASRYNFREQRQRRRLWLPHGQERPTHLHTLFSVEFAGLLIQTEVGGIPPQTYRQTDSLFFNCLLQPLKLHLCQPLTLYYYYSELSALSRAGQRLLMAAVQFESFL